MEARNGDLAWKGRLGDAMEARNGDLSWKGRLGDAMQHDSHNNNDLPIFLSNNRSGGDGESVGDVGHSHS